MDWVQHATRHITDHFGDESLQTIDCTGTDNQTTSKRNTQNKKRLPDSNLIVRVLFCGAC